METKSKWKSKGFWLGILIMLGGVAEYFAGIPAEASVPTIIAGALAVVIRFLTSQPISKTITISVNKLLNAASEKAYKQVMERIFKEIEKMPVLSDEELNKAWETAFGIPVAFDHKPTAEEIFTIELKTVVQAQKADILRRLKGELQYLYG